MSRIDIPESAQQQLRNSITITSLPVQWGDQDAFGHVNNVIYFRWFESARIDLLEKFESSVSMSGQPLGPILASINCDYRKQLRFPDTVHIGSRVAAIGRTSIQVRHQLFSEHWDGIAAEASSVLVIFDYNLNRPVRVPDELRLMLEKAGEAE
ncbi:MAG: acyl-CoA thioesterase [Planctomycetaceae bacterium]|nr:acyl-CoA thioesterase [Planctomycetaceae bacterium]